MNDAEFRLYLETICDLYPDMADVPGRRLLMKLDSGPGRRNIMTTAWARAKGLYLYGGVPNTTSVTQELDRSYGPFKTAYNINLEKLTKHRMKTAANSGEPKFLISDYGFIMFGGVEEEGGHKIELENTFEKCFSIEKNQHMLAKVGAAPVLTEACLNDAKVRHEIIINDKGEIDLTKDPQAAKLDTICQRNKSACDMLNERGLNGEKLRVDLKRISAISTIPVTRPKTKERQEALAAATTAGEIFHHTKANHHTADDMQIGVEHRIRKKKLKILMKKRENMTDGVQREREAFAVITKLSEKGICVYGNPQSTAISMNDVKALLRWKLNSSTLAAEYNKNNEDRRKKWAEIKDNAIPNTEWTDELEAEHAELTREDLTIDDTEVGREKKRHKTIAMAAIAVASPASKAKYKAALQSPVHANDNNNNNNAADNDNSFNRNDNNNSNNRQDTGDGGLHNITVDLAAEEDNDNAADSSNAGDNNRAAETVVASVDHTATGEDAVTNATTNTDSGGPIDTFETRTNNSDSIDK